jgi:hypothetical protein
MQRNCPSTLGARVHRLEHLINWPGGKAIARVQVLNLTGVEARFDRHVLDKGAGAERRQSFGVLVIGLFALCWVVSLVFFNSSDLPATMDRRKLDASGMAVLAVYKKQTSICYRSRTRQFGGFRIICFVTPRCFTAGRLL